VARASSLQFRLEITGLTTSRELTCDKLTDLASCTHAEHNYLCANCASKAGLFYYCLSDIGMYQISGSG